ncbi:MAG: hypothetical protein J7J92_01265 [Candidatus Aenigmarchaeota archaeon]|nr:hypothetical protein [Candidatus Aenigmarchaeota archaeon]
MVSSIAARIATGLAFGYFSVNIIATDRTLRKLYKLKEESEEEFNKYKSKLLEKLNQTGVKIALPIEYAFVKKHFGWDDDSKDYSQI